MTTSPFSLQQGSYSHFSKWENYGSERLSVLPKVRQLTGLFKTQPGFFLLCQLFPFANLSNLCQLQPLGLFKAIASKQLLLFTLIECLLKVRLYSFNFYSNAVR